MILRSAILCGAASAGAFAATSVSAQTMNAEQFYNRASALERMGLAAISTSDFGTILNEIQGATDAAQVREQRARRAGRPLYCMPPGPRENLTARQMLDLVERVPVTERQRMTTTDLWLRLHADRYPCRGSTTAAAVRPTAPRVATPARAPVRPTPASAPRTRKN